MAHPCSSYREAISARLDGEVGAISALDVDRHVAGCESCTQYVAGAESLTRMLAVRPAPAVPDLTAQLLVALDTPDRAQAKRHQEQLSWLLGLVGTVQVVLAAVAMASTSGAGLHTSREAGIFALALGVGFIVVAVQPSRASGLLPVAAIVAVLATITSISDIASGSSSLIVETAHLAHVIGTALLWHQAHQDSGLPRAVAHR